jgi:hypothetical protein
MGFYAPSDMDAIGKAQLAILEAASAQFELSMKTKLRFAGLEYVNRFRKPETDDQFLLGYWEGMQSVHHTLGGVHLGILDSFNRRKAVTEQGGNR